MAGLFAAVQFTAVAAGWNACWTGAWRRESRVQRICPNAEGFTAGFRPAITEGCIARRGGMGCRFG